MSKQVQRLRTATKQVERPQEQEQPERDSRADEVSEQAECCLADIDAVLDEACCLIEEAADMLTPTEGEFAAARQILKDAYWRMDAGTSEEEEAWAALKAYENKWPQYAHLCTC